MFNNPFHFHILKPPHLIERVNFLNAMTLSDFCCQHGTVNHVRSAKPTYGIPLEPNVLSLPPVMPTGLDKAGLRTLCDGWGLKHSPYSDEVMVFDLSYSVESVCRLCSCNYSSLWFATELIKDCTHKDTNTRTHRSTRKWQIGQSYYCPTCLFQEQRTSNRIHRQIQMDRWIHW